MFAICEQTPQTDKWVLKQLRDQRFQIGDRSFATYVLTPGEVAYYTLLAEGDKAVLQVCDLFILLPWPPHHQFFFVVKAKQKWIFEEIGPQPWALFDRSNFVPNAAAAGANATSVAKSFKSTTIAAQRQLVRCDYCFNFNCLLNFGSTGVKSPLPVDRK